MFKKPLTGVWWYILVIPAFRRLRQEDREFKAVLGYKCEILFSKKQNKTKTKLTNQPNK
jgi:hypothetical protein